MEKQIFTFLDYHIYFATCIALAQRCGNHYNFLLSRKLCLKSYMTKEADNLLKQGISPEAALQSWQQALELHRASLGLQNKLYSQALEDLSSAIVCFKQVSFGSALR